MTIRMYLETIVGLIKKNYGNSSEYIRLQSGTASVGRMAGLRGQQGGYCYYGYRLLSRITALLRLRRCSS